jgi:hypothetical protein
MSTSPFSEAEIQEAMAIARGPANGDGGHNDPRGDIPPTENPAEFGKQPNNPPPTPAILITPSSWPAEEPPPVDWLAYQRIPRGDVTTLHGDGAAGKTDLRFAWRQISLEAPPIGSGMRLSTGWSSL